MPSPADVEPGSRSSSFPGRIIGAEDRGCDQGGHHPGGRPPGSPGGGPPSPGSSPAPATDRSASPRRRGAPGGRGGWQRAAQATPVGAGVSEDEVKAARFSGRLIQKLRARLGLSQMALGRLVGVSGAAVVQWERGRASPSAPNRKALVALRRRGRREVRRLLERVANPARTRPRRTPKRGRRQGRRGGR
jgi:DNA-binding transcriptional regulator YiaG